MADAGYKEILAKLEWKLREIREEQAELEVRRSELDKETANIKATIVKLLPLCGQAVDLEDLSSLGFTDAIRRVIEFGNPRMSANDVKDALTRKGFDLAGYSNPMASIYKILTRLKEAGEIDSEAEGFNVFYSSNKKKPFRFKKKNRPNPFRPNAPYGARSSIANTPNELLDPQASPGKKP